MLVAQESNTERQVLDRRKDNFIEKGDNPGEKVDLCSKETTPHCQQRTRDFKEVFQGCVGGERRLHAETSQSALTIILKLVISGLISVIFIVLSTVNLQFQGWFVPISLRPAFTILAAYVMAIARLSCS